jgi:glycosyltransferase involved in cell wall biosynthesis
MSGDVMKYGICLVTYNELHYMAQCLEALIAHAPPEGFYLAVVDNGSTDGTQAWIRERMEKAPAHIEIIFKQLVGNPGWCSAVNAGFGILYHHGCEFMVMLNNDTIPHGDWLDRLALTFDDYHEKTGDFFGRVGLVGPVSNNVGGVQKLEIGNAEPRLVDKLYERCANEMADIRDDAGFLSGFCMMVRRECYEAIIEEQRSHGVSTFTDERFNLGGFEDNDIVLMAQRRGFKAVINASVFIYHYGSVTVQKYCPELYMGLPKRVDFCDKWAPIRESERKLLALIRTKNGASKTLKEVLDHTATFTDGILVLSDGSTDDTVKICEDHPAVLEVRHYDREFNERRDRNELLEMAIDHGAHWGLSVDDDELFMADRQRFDQLMTTRNPHLLCYGFKWYTFWNEERTLYRTDDTFGPLGGFRMTRLLPGRGIFKGNENGLHCGNIPGWPEFNCSVTDIRVKHLGFDVAEKREAKYEFYEKIDTDKKIDLIGHEDYAHVKSEDVTVKRWIDQDGLSLNVIVKNEGKHLHGFLEFWEPFVDEIIVVDTGSTDNTREIARLFTDEVYDYKMKDGLDLGGARNFAKNRSSFRWVLAMDPDEMVDQLALWMIRMMMNENDVDAYHFQFDNIYSTGQKARTTSIRLMRNIPEIYWSRPVHETVEHCFKHFVRPYKIKIASDFVVQHYGFTKPEEIIQDKLDEYRKATLRYMMENPGDPQPYYNNGMYFWNEGRFDEAEKWFKEALERSSTWHIPMVQLADVAKFRAMNYYMQILEVLPPDHPTRPIMEEQLKILKQITPPPIAVGPKAKEMRARDQAEERERKEAINAG